jgi:hypothetical protein
MIPRLGVTAMNMHERFLDPEGTTVGATELDQSSWLGLLRAWLVARVRRLADQYAAAVAYDALSGLSDAALKHRSLSRDILARDLSTGRDRAVGDRNHHGRVESS